MFIIRNDTIDQWNFILTENTSYSSQLQHDVVNVKIL